MGNQTTWKPRRTESHAMLVKFKCSPQSTFRWVDQMVRLIDLFDGFCQVFVDKNADKAIKLFAEDANILGPGFSVSGKNEIKKFFEAEAPKIEGYTVTKKSIIEKENEIAVEWKVYHKYKPTAKEINVNGVTLITAEKGLIKSLRDYCDFPPS